MSDELDDIFREAKSRAFRLDEARLIPGREMREALIDVIAFLASFVQIIDDQSFSKSTPREDYSRLQDLSQRWDECTSCDLCANRGARMFDTRFEPSLYCGIVFVGEGPGEREKEKGIPFCGPAGEVFDRCLKRLGLTRAHVYVTNVVKHRAEQDGKDRPPTESERNICKNQWLWRELKLMQPRVVVPLGGSALMALEPDPHVGTITQCAGRKVITRLQEHVPSAIVVPILHPAYVLHNPEKRPDLGAALDRLKAILVKEGILEEAK